MPGGIHHEWGKLREVVIGICPADALVVFYEESQRWLTPEAADFARKHARRQLLDVDPEKAKRIELQVDALAELLDRQGVKVHRPERLQGEERTFMAPNGEGGQLFARDGIIVVADHVIDASLRSRCRQRERFGLRPIIQAMVAVLFRRLRYRSIVCLR